MKNVIRSALVLTSASLFAIAAIAPAEAVADDKEISNINVGSTDLSPNLLEEAYRDLIASAAPRTSTNADADGMVLTTFTLPTGSTFTFRTPEVVSYLGGGWDDQYGLYVEFNRVDQGVLLAGGGTALGVALCAIPGAGIPLCVVVSGVVAAATAALAASGMCKNNLRIYAQMLGYPECR